MPNQRWTLDFVFDELVIGARVVCELNYLIAECSAPKMIVSDSGTEPGAGVVGAKWHYIVLGTPTQNGSWRV